MEKILIHYYKKENNQETKVTEDNCVRKLICKTKNYSWGECGRDSIVARMKASQTTNFQIVESSPYAELWMGTHHNGMSSVIFPHINDNNINFEVISLLDYVQKNPRMHLGVHDPTKSLKKYNLTFLLKVLSIKNVLSIQAHPDKNMAKQLNEKYPNIYRDSNHKPEMAIALGDDFEAMSGFRPIAEIAEHLHKYPELSILIGSELTKEIMDVSSKSVKKSKTILKIFFQKIMESPEVVVQKQVDALANRLMKKEKKTDIDKLILKLVNQFPSDIGVFSPLILNCLKLKCGDALYIGPNEPHAYVKGDILECMACSDNVVRAGLTCKMKDINTLLKILTYKSDKPEIIRGTKIDENTLLYIPPVDDFAIEIIHINVGSRYIIRNVRSPSIILNLHGSGILQQPNMQLHSISFGKSFFISANTSTTIIADESGLGVKLARAFSNIFL